MSSGPQEQLELFDLSVQPRAKVRQHTLGRLWLSVRYDQLVLAGIAGLIGVTVVFACGVERGKQLVRVERLLLVPQETKTAQVQPRPAASAVNVFSSPAAASVRTPAANSQPVPASTPKKSEPSKPAMVKSHYAVQVVSYRQPQLAKHELNRLQGLGERAFLMLRGGYAVLYVGPFPSKEHALEKLVGLKTRYQGCFLKVL